MDKTSKQDMVVEALAKAINRQNKGKGVKSLTTEGSKKFKNLCEQGCGPKAANRTVTLPKYEGLYWHWHKATVLSVIEGGGE